MHTVVTIDQQPNSNVVAVWLTNRDGLEAHHTNAVVVDLQQDSAAQDKIRRLTRHGVVLITDGSTLKGLPVSGTALTLADIDQLIDETEAHHLQITDAVEDYAQRTRANLVMPSPHRVPDPGSATAENTAPLRALFVANRMLRAWSAWLRTDEERRRRTVQPKTGHTPWIMPAELNSPTVADFPPSFEARLHRQPAT